MRWAKAALIFTVVPVFVYIITPAFAQKAGFAIPSTREIPYRNNYTWFLRPWKNGYDGPERFAKEALAAVEKPSIIFADGTTVYPLWYVQTFELKNSQVKIVSNHGSYESPIGWPTEQDVERLLTDYSIYVVSPVRGYCPEFLLERYNFVQSGVIWKINGRK